MSVNIGPRIGIDGEAEYRKQINQIIQETKTLKSEYEKVSSSMEKGKTTLKGNAEQHKILSEQIRTQEERIKQLNAMLQESSAKYGENDAKTLKWKQAVNEATTELNRMQAELKELPSRIQLIGDNMQSAGDKIKTAGGHVESFARSLAPISAAATAALGGSAKAAIDFESAFTGVQKTVDATEEEFGQLSDWIKEASTKMASSKKDIAATMEIAGQLGIEGVQNLEKFTETMVMLGDTTNLTSEEAASALAKFMNITGESTGNVGKLGSVIVDLGNHYATTEADIVNMSTRMAAAGSIAGLSSTDILALATAISSVGIESEAGGTAMSQTFQKISTAVDEGSDSLDTYARIAGMSADKFAATWKGEPIEAIQAFIRGLGSLDKENESVIGTLDELGLSGMRQSNMLQALSLSADNLSDAVKTANSAYGENIALTEEAEKRYGTYESKLSQTKESLTNVAIEMGERLLPYIDKGIGYLDRAITAWDNLDEETKDNIVTATAAVAAAAPVLSVIGKITSGLGGLVSGAGKVVGAVGKIAPAVSAAASSIGTFFTADLGAALSAGGAAAAGTAAASVGSALVTAFAGAEIGKKLGTYIFPDDAELYREYSGITGTLNMVKDTALGVADVVKWGVEDAWTTAQKKGHDLKERWTSDWNAMKSNAKSNMDSIKSGFSSASDSIKNTWSSAVSNAKSKFTEIKSAASGLVENLKSAFRFDWKLPSIKLPHFKISGKFSLDPPSVPSIGVDWYAKAMENGMKLSGATIFGAANGRLLGGGEAGNEWIVGENSLMGMIRSAVGTATAQAKGGSVNIGDTTIVINTLPGQDEREIADMVDNIITTRLEQAEAAWA